jgi:tetratricopeptide (TPR) repeat protein
MTKEVMKMAMDALNDCTYDEEGYCFMPDNEDAIAALRQAIDALESACGNRCNSEYNPCEYREAAGVLKQIIETYPENDNQAEPYDQQALELCDKCGWKAVIPGDCCLNCEREKTAVTQQLTDEGGGKHPPPLSDAKKHDLATNWFADGWAINAALGLLEDYDHAIEREAGIQQLTTEPLTHERINELMESADAKWADADVPMHWARRFARAIEREVRGK